MCDFTQDIAELTPEQSSLLMGFFHPGLSQSLRKQPAQNLDTPTHTMDRIRTETRLRSERDAAISPGV